MSGLGASAPGYARGGSYENRREGDRIIQDASAPIPSFRYNALAYSPETYPAASPALLPAEPARAGNPAGVHAEVPVAQRAVEKPEPEPGMPVRPPAPVSERITPTPTARSAPPASAQATRTASRPPARAIPVAVVAPQKPKAKEEKPALAKPHLHIPVRVAQSHAEARRAALKRAAPPRHVPAQPHRVPPPLWR